MLQKETYVDYIRHQRSRRYAAGGAVNSGVGTATGVAAMDAGPTFFEFGAHAQEGHWVPIVVSVWCWPAGHDAHEYTGQFLVVTVEYVAHAQVGHWVPIVVSVWYWHEGHPAQEYVGHDLGVVVVEYVAHAQ